MSSVNSANGRSDQNDEIRRLREEYRKKEADLIKRQNKELARANEAHETDMDRAEKQQGHDLEETREKTKEVITQRDAKYQKEIQDMRAMQTKQLERIAEDNAGKVEAQRKASTSEVTDEKMSKNEREKDLLDKYNTMQRTQEDKFSTELQTLRGDERDALIEQKNEQKRAREKELDGVREERNERVADLESQNHKMYESTTQRLKDQQMSHVRDMQRLEDGSMDTLKRSQVADGVLMEQQRQGYQQGLRQTKSDFAKRRENDMAMNDEARDKFHDDVSSRIDGQVNRLSRDLASANNRGVMAETEAKSAAQREINDTRDAYQTKLENLEKERKGILEQTNDRIGQKVKLIHGETDKQMATNTRYYMDQMQMEDAKDYIAREQLTTSAAQREKYLTDRAHNQVDKVRADSVTSENELKGTFQSDLEMQKAGFEEKKKDIVFTNEKDKAESIARLRDQAGKAENDHQVLLNTVTDKYEKRITELNDQMLRERRLGDKHSQSVIKDLTRERENDIANLKLKYEEREKAMAVAHQQEMNEMNRRQQEKLDEFLTTQRKQT